MSAARSYIPPAEIGEVMRALAAGRVIVSRHPGFAPGDLVYGPFGMQEHAVSDGRNGYKIEVTGRLTAAALSWRAGPDGTDGVFRAAGRQTAERRRDRARLAGGRARRDGRQPDREDQGRHGGRYHRRPKVVTPDTRTPRVIEPNLLDGTKAPPALAEGFRRVASSASNRDVITLTPKTSS
jgi:hypothetical protein